MNATEVSLLDAAELVRGVSYKREEARSKPAQGLVPIVRATNIQDGHLVLDDLVYVPSSRVSEQQRIRRGDIVFAMSSGSRDVVGKAALALTDVGAGFGAFCGVLRARPGTRADWLAHYMRSPLYRRAIDRVATGTNINNLSKSTLAAIDVPSMSEREQAEISTVLTSAEGAGSRAVEHLDDAKRALDQFRLSVLAAACSGRLTADWRARTSPSESAAALIARSEAIVRSNATRRAVDGEWSPPDWLEIPDTWQWAPTRSLAFIKGGIQKQPKRAPKANSYPYLRVANVLRGRLDLSVIHDFELFANELATYRLEAGDLLVVEGNGSGNEIGRAAIWRGEVDDCVHQNHIIRVRSIAADPDFLALFWNSPIGAREIASLAVTSAGLYSLSTKKIGSVPIPVAPLDEQREIVRRTTTMLALADAVLSSVESARRRIERSLQAILAKAFRGESSLPSVIESAEQSVAG